MSQENFIWGYAKTHGLQGFESYSKEASRKTGFANIDAKMRNFQPCLGLLVASSSAGKTSFAIQLGDQLAQQGENVIFIGYETPKIEVLARMLSRRMKLLDTSSTFSAYDIMCNEAHNDPIFQQAFKEITNNTQLNFRMWNPTSSEGIPWIINQLNQTIKSEPHLRKPFVIIDYVQIIPHNGDIKSMLDKEIPKLKQFQMETNCTILLISSTSRSNYFRSLSLDSAKESGVLESSANLVWALQYSILDKQTTDPLTGEEVEDYKRQAVRQMTLKCLKQRHGEDFDVYLDYHPKFELFVERYKPNDSNSRKTLKER